MIDLCISDVLYHINDVVMVVMMNTVTWHFPKSSTLQESDVYT
jgi:hypothetical protein